MSEEERTQDKTEDQVRRAEELVERVRTLRAQVDELSDPEDAERLIGILGELSDISKEAEAELERIRRRAGADA
jgi:hypothetical protein